MMRNSRRGLAAGVNFIWDLPMTLLLIFSNITSHRRRLSKPEFNSIQIGSLVWIWIDARCARRRRCHTDAARRLTINSEGIFSLGCTSAARALPGWPLLDKK